MPYWLQMGDALIAATALDHELPVLTANVKHFSAVEGLKVEAFLPRCSRGQPGNFGTLSSSGAESMDIADAKRSIRSTTSGVAIFFSSE